MATVTLFYINSLEVRTEYISRVLKENIKLNTYQSKPSKCYKSILICLKGS